MLRAIDLSSMTNSSALQYERKRPMPASIRQRNDLALQHLGLAGFVASRLQRQGLDDLDDLMQEARIVDRLTQPELNRCDLDAD